MVVQRGSWLCYIFFGPYITPVEAFMVRLADLILKSFNLRGIVCNVYPGWCQTVLLYGQRLLFRLNGKELKRKGVPLDGHARTNGALRIFMMSRGGSFLIFAFLYCGTSVVRVLPLGFIKYIILSLFFLLYMVYKLLSPVDEGGPFHRPGF